MILICSYCKKIKNNDNKWVEKDRKNLDNILTHGICPDCYKIILKNINLLKYL